MKTVVMFIGVMFAITGLIFGISFLLEAEGTAKDSFFQPLHEQVRRQTFEQSRAYREGLAQEIQAMQFEYVDATKEHKDALASIILHRTAGMDLTTLPGGVQQFVASLRAERGLK